MLNINDREEVLAYFNSHPNEMVKIYCPGSGSWYETFDTKEQYLARETSNNALTEWVKKSPDGVLNKEGNRLLRDYSNCRGRVSPVNFYE